MATKQLNQLNKLNVIAACLHAAQALVVLVISKDFALHIKTDHLVYNRALERLELSNSSLFSVSLPLLIVAFFVLSSLAHLSVATFNRKRYESQLAKGINAARWYEYSLSASIMIVAISLLVGVYDASILLAVFILTAVMNLMGLVMEVTNQGAKRPNWLSYNIGVLAGAVPWVIIAFYLWASNHYGDAAPPTFVYWIFVSIFIFFSSFALNMWLQYKKIGKWSNYLYGEKVYMLLSLLAKSALAWQVFAGTLRP